MSNEKQTLNNVKAGGNVTQTIGRDEPVEAILQFFSYAHLPEHLQIVSEPFGELANEIVARLPRNAERSVALRKLLESKDAAVRALLAK